jgi:hypothetical protein
MSKSRSYIRPDDGATIIEVEPHSTSTPRSRAAFPTASSTMSRPRLRHGDSRRSRIKPAGLIDERFSLVCLSPRKVRPPASGPGHARQVLLLQ